MPQPFEFAKMTNAGIALLNKAQAESIRMEFTRMVIGAGEYMESEKTPEALQQRTELKDARNSYGISYKDVTTQNQVKLKALLTNQDPITHESLVEEGYYINEIGLYAREYNQAGTEVLYSVAVTTGTQGDYMPPYDGSSPAEITQEYYATVTDAEDVVIMVTGTGTVALAEDLIKKADKVIGATDGNLAGLDENGNLQDSGTKPYDWLNMLETASGTDLALETSAGGIGITKIHGNTVQGENPSPTNPQEIYGSGQDGGITFSINNEDSTQSSTLLLPLSSPLYKIGDVEDYIDVERGVIVRNFARKKMLPTNWNYYGFTKSGLFGTRATNYDFASPAQIICNNYTFVRIAAYLNNTCGIDGNGNLWICDERIDNTNDFSDYLSNNDVIVVARLNTPTTEPLTPEQIKILHSIEAFDGKTYITTEDIAKAEFDVEYSKSDVGILALANKSRIDGQLQGLWFHVDEDGILNVTYEEDEQ